MPAYMPGTVDQSALRSSEQPETQPDGHRNRGPSVQLFAEIADFLEKERTLVIEAYYCALTRAKEQGELHECHDRDGQDDLRQEDSRRHRPGHSLDSRLKIVGSIRVRLNDPSSIEDRSFCKLN
jgi:hypothetical protein